MKDGRHVGLDFYDLLIEALRSNIALYLGYTPSIADSSSGDARMTLKGGYGITLAFVGLRTGPLLKMTKPIRIAANSHQVTLTDLIRRQLFEVTNLEFWRLTLTSTHFFQALQSFQ